MLSLNEIYGSMIHLSHMSHVWMRMDLSRDHATGHLDRQE